MMWWKELMMYMLSLLKNTEVTIENWLELDLKARPLSSVQAL